MKKGTVVMFLCAFGILFLYSAVKLIASVPHIATAGFVMDDSLVLVGLTVVVLVSWVQMKELFTKAYR